MVAPGSARWASKASRAVLRSAHYPRADSTQQSAHRPWRRGRVPTVRALCELDVKWTVVRSERRTRPYNDDMNAIIVATIAGGLLLDQFWPGHGQHVVSAVAWALMAALLWRTEPASRKALIACLVVATAGEVFLSLIWGLYRYRQGNIPLFVPPGHVLLFFLGLRIAEKLPERSVAWIAALAAPLVGLLAWNGRDTLGPLLYGLFVLCLWLSPSRRLYATMFVLSLAMELYGTWIGNWRWNDAVPWLGLTTTNPPIAAGAFYCVLDLLVVALANPDRKRIREGKDFSGIHADAR
jgi:hypothetical protein